MPLVRTGLILLLTLPLILAEAAAQQAPAAGTLVVRRPEAPLVPFLPAATSPTLSAERRHQLTGLRVRSQGATLRLIFLFDQPTPYSLRIDSENQRATLDLINTQVTYLPPDVARLRDDRLDGVWARRLDPGLASLELRLPSRDIRIEHFAISNPAAVVIDLTRTDRTIARLSGPQIVANLPVAEGSIPSAPVELVRNNGAVVPRNWLTASSQTHPTSATMHQTFSSASQLVAEAPSTSGQQIARIDEHAGDEIGPKTSDFEGFPIDSMELASALGTEIFEDFLQRRWGMVFDRGVAYLKNNPVNQESVDVLYMLAEAQWRMGRDRQNVPLEAMINAWHQAVRTHGEGPLASFGRARLAEAALMQDDFPGANYQIDLSLSHAPPSRRFYLQTLKARALAGEKREREALALLSSLDIPALQKEQRLELVKQTAAIRQQAGDAAGAWAAFEEARVIDPEWTSLDFANWERMAFAARDTGHLEEAIAAVQELLRHYDNRDAASNYRLFLLRAELQEKTGDTQTAALTYETVLHQFGDSLTGASIQRQARGKFPEEFLASEGRYCLLLWKEDKHRHAMSELNRVHQQCIREGIDPGPLQPIFQAVLPDFMKSALEENQPFDVLQGWRLYQHFMKDPHRRAACREPLLRAMESMGLYRDALAMLDADRASSTTAGRVIARSRLLQGMNDYEAAIRLLEAPLDENATARERRDADLLLARAYLNENRELEAAQAFRAVAESAHAAPDQRAEATLEAGNLFLSLAMPLPAVELGVQALVLESDSEHAGREPWPAKQSAALRLMLARAFFAARDHSRAEILLNDYLAIASAPAADRALARLLIAHAQQRLGKTGAALAVCKAAIADPETPAIHIEEARQMQQLLEWDLKNPRWALHGPARMADAKTP